KVMDPFLRKFARGEIDPRTGAPLGQVPEEFGGAVPEPKPAAPEEQPPWQAPLRPKRLPPSQQLLRLQQGQPPPPVPQLPPPGGAYEAPPNIPATEEQRKVPKEGEVIQMPGPEAKAGPPVPVPELAAPQAEKDAAVGGLRRMGFSKK